MAQTAERAPRVFFLSLRVKLLLIFTLLFAITFAGVFIGFYNFATALAMNNLKRDLMATALTAASGIDGDAFVQLYRSGQMDDPTYTAIAEFLRSIKRANPKAAGMYTFLQLPDEPTQVRFVVSAALPPGVTPSARDAALIEARPKGCTVLSSNRPKMSQPYTQDIGLTPTALNSVRQAGVDNATYTDSWGTWLSGYAPLSNAAGQPVGAVGVDMCAADVTELQNNILQTMLPAFVLTLAVLVIAVLALASRVTRPIHALTRAAQRIGQGDYGQNLAAFRSGRMRDEVATLTEVFELMVGKVYQREQTLRRQVEELKIEIDEAKRQKQVSEIVDSDYFQNVQARALAMRQRRQQSDSSSSLSTGTPPA
jgi:methyl-accepting chemotaxis protein